MVNINKRFILAGFILVFAVLLVQGVSAAAPAINLTYPVNDTWYNVDDFNITANDAGYATNTSANITGDWFAEETFWEDQDQTADNKVLKEGLTEGIHWIYYKVWNASNVSQINSTNITFYVDTTPPTITNFTANPNVSISFNNPMTISAYVSDVNLDYVEIEIIDNNNLIESDQTIFLVLHNEPATNGTYALINWSASYLNISNGTISELITAGFDTTPPTEIIVFGYFKKNTTESAQSDCALIFDASGPPPLTLLAVVNETWDDLTIENGTSNFTVVTYRYFGVDGPPNATNGSTFTLYNIPNALNPYLTGGLVPSGDYEVSLMAWDSLDNHNIEQANITVDNDAPTVNLETPVDTANLTTADVNLTFNVIDNLATTLSCSLYINDTFNETNASVSNGTSTTFTVIFSDGSYSWYINCSDGANNINVSSTRIFSVDVGTPSISFADPTPSNGSSVRQSQTIKVTATSPNLDTLQIFINNTVVKTCNSTPCSFIWETANGSYTDGTYYINATANDTYSNINSTDIREIIVDNTPPTITSFSLSDTTVYKGDDLTGSCSANDTMDSSVSTSISGDTSSIGTFTATCTATDNAGNTATLSRSYTVKSKSIGGIAGTYTPPPPSHAQVWSEITAGATVDMSIAKTEIGFTKLSINIKNKVNNVEIKVIKLSAKPASITHEIKGKLYQYIQVDKTNIKDEDISEADIEFRVEKSWMTANNIAENNIALNRYTIEWVKLLTEKIASDATYIYYKATTPGFSYFAISEKEVVVEEKVITEEKISPCVEDWECTSWSECEREGIQTKSCYDKNACGTVINKPAEQQNCIYTPPVEEEKAKIPTGWIIAVIVVIAVVIYLACPKKKHKHHKHK